MKGLAEAYEPALTSSFSRFFSVKLSAFIIQELSTLLITAVAAETEIKHGLQLHVVGEANEAVACLARLQQRNPESRLCWCCGLAEGSSRQCVRAGVNKVRVRVCCGAAG